MASYRKIRFAGFRNLVDVDLSLSTVNIIYGQNGSGKTSFLESISVLSHNRSFRTNKSASMIKNGDQRYTVYGEVEVDKNVNQVGVSRAKNGANEIRINGRNVNSATELAAIIPLKILYSRSFDLLSDSPESRRRFFDWLVFHVEHEFGENWKSYQRCIRQRNMALKTQGAIKDQLAIDSWSLQAAEFAENIDRYRAECFSMLKKRFQELMEESELSYVKDIRISYERGWAGDRSLKEVFEQNYQRDLKRGFTGDGPHKSQIKFYFGDKPAQEVLSRGQQKLLVVLLHVCQAYILTKLKGRSAVFLLDDLPSELDDANMKRLSDWLSELNSQLFVTGVSKSQLENSWSRNQNDIQVFHVEHGLVKQL